MALPTGLAKHDADQRILQMLLYTYEKTRGIVEKGNLETVERDSDNRQALVKVADALKLRVKRTMFGAEIAQKRWKLEQ